jgi:hypothetical protein
MPDLSMQGVIDRATGDLVRFGFCDFANDGRFDPKTEELRRDLPDQRFGRDGLLAHLLTRWSETEQKWLTLERQGDEWKPVDKPSLLLLPSRPIKVPQQQQQQLDEQAK